MPSPSATSGAPPRCTFCGRELQADASSAGAEVPCRYCGHLVWFRSQEDTGFVVLNLMADLDLERADLERVGRLLVESAGAPRVVLNLSNVEYVSSTFLGRLLAMQKRIDTAGGSLVLAGLNPVVREIFQVTKLESFFTFADSPAAADDA